jgi:hypothetical protein
MSHIVYPIWFGLFTVTGPKENNILDGDAGACLWIAAQAEDAVKLEVRASSAMEKLGLTVVEAEHLQEVQDEDELSEQVSRLIPQARRDVESVVCGTWHTFKHHDA